MSRLKKKLLRIFPHPLMNFPLWISRRLKLNGSANTANATGTAIAVTGVALAIIIMAATLAIVNGFKHGITERIMAFEPQISVLPSFDYDSGVSSPYLSKDSALAEAIAATIPAANVSLRFTQPAVIKTDNDFAGIYIQAYDSAHDYSFEKSNVVAGTWPDLSADSTINAIAISSAIANSLQLSAGDKVYAYFFVNEAVKTRRFTIGAIYNTGFSDYDKVTAFGNLSAMQSVAGTDSVTGTQLAISVNEPAHIEDYAAELQGALLQAYRDGDSANLYPIDNVRHTGAIFFNWLQLLDTNVVVIFILMACVAGFTIISSMFILILDRISTIGLLRAMGASGAQIRNIFALMAMKTVGLGMIIGNAIAIALLLCQEKWHVMRLDPEMYYLTHVPVEINWWWMVALNIGVAVIAWCLLLIPAHTAAKVSPATTMRFE